MNDVTPGILLAASLVAQVADYVITVKALDRGYTEVGPINGPVVKKWGKDALPLATFIEAVFVVVLGGFFGWLGNEYLASFAATVLGMQVYGIIKDLRAEKKI
jgi:hypothetical protein